MRWFNLGPQILLMRIFIIPAIVALLINSIVLVAAFKGRHQSETLTRFGPKGSQSFLNMVSVFVLLLLLEVVGFLEFFQGSAIEYHIRCYYVVSLFALSFVIFYAAEISGRSAAKVRAFVWPPVAIVSLLILGTDFIVAGTQSIGYIRTALPGQYYQVFQLLALVLQLSLPLMLGLAYFRSTDSVTRTQCAYTLVAMLPIFLGSIILIGLMALGIRVNAACLMPIFITFFVLLTTYNESKHRLIDVRRFVPFSPERKAANKIMDIYTRYERDQLSYRDAISDIERLLVMSKYEKSGGNASATAKQLGMPRTSLYSIFTRLGIDKKDPS